jgi:hypothetical protein
MKFMILVKATKDSEAGKMPPESLLQEMGGFHEEMAKAGILVDGAGLQRSEKGWRIKYGKNGQKSVVDGPFTETKEMVAGYSIINVKDREEALKWTKRFPNPAIDGGEGEIEVRQYFELEDFGDSPAVERMKSLQIGE